MPVASFADERRLNAPFSMGSIRSWHNRDVRTDEQPSQGTHHMKKILIASLALAATTGAGLAHETKSIDRTQARQLEEIEKGRYTGQLTRKEYRDLVAEQAYIKRLENQAKADGRVTKREYSAIRDAQKAAEKHIYAESHDNQRALWRRWLYLHRN